MVSGLFFAIGLIAVCIAFFLMELGYLQQEENPMGMGIMILIVCAIFWFGIVGTTAPATDKTKVYDITKCEVLKGKTQIVFIVGGKNYTTNGMEFFNAVETGKSIYLKQTVTVYGVVQGEVLSLNNIVE